MARELVLGAQFDARSVMAMTADEVRYWYEAARARQKELEERRQQ